MERRKKQKDHKLSNFVVFVSKAIRLSKPIVETCFTWVAFAAGTKEAEAAPTAEQF